MDFYCTADKLRKTIYTCLVLFIRWEGKRRITDERENARRPTNPLALSPPLSSVKIALVFKNFAQGGNGNSGEQFLLDLKTLTLFRGLEMYMA